MSGGKGPKRKGDEGEREISRLFGGERSFWQPGNRGDQVRGDVLNIPYLGRAEVKRRGDGFRSLYAWLADNDALFLRADRKPWLVVIRAEDLQKLLTEMDELKCREVG